MRLVVQLIQKIKEHSGLKPFQASRLKIIAMIVLSGFVIASLYCIYNILIGKPYPYNTFLFDPNARFSDLMDTVKCLRHGAVPYDSIGPGRGYFPFFYLLLYPFSFLGSDGIILCIMIPFGVFYTLLGLSFIKPENKKNLIYALIILFLAYPLLFLIDRGNVEMILYLFIFLFVYFYIKGKYGIAALVLAVAINCKLYPGVLAILFIKDKKYKAAVLTILYSAILFIAGMYFCNWNFSGFKANLDWFVKTYANSNYGVPFSHTIWGIYKYILIYFTHIGYFSAAQANELIKLMMFPYVLLTIFILLVTSLYVVFIEKTFWKNVFLLIALFQILPQVSFDYTLISFMIPLILFIISENKDSGSSDKIYCIFWGLVMIPMNWAHLSVSPLLQYTIIVRPLLIIFMMSYIMVNGLLKCNFKNDFKHYFIKG